MIEIPRQLEAIQREVGKQPIDGGEGIGVLLRQTYPAGIDEVWEALTDPDRIKRWFMPISGDLHPGGNFQLEGTQVVTFSNASQPFASE